MGKPGCIVPGCKPSEWSSRFKFPNPEKNSDLFKKWKDVIGNSVVSQMCTDMEIALNKYIKYFFVLLSSLSESTRSLL